MSERKIPKTVVNDYLMTKSTFPGVGKRYSNLHQRQIYRGTDGEIVVHGDRGSVGYHETNLFAAVGNFRTNRN